MNPRKFIILMRRLRALVDLSRFFFHFGVNKIVPNCHYIHSSNVGIVLSLDLRFVSLDSLTDASNRRKSHTTRQHFTANAFRIEARFCIWQSIFFLFVSVFLHFLYSALASTSHSYAHIKQSLQNIAALQQEQTTNKYYRGLMEREREKKNYSIDCGFARKIPNNATQETFPHRYTHFVWKWRNNSVEISFCVITREKKRELCVPIDKRNGFVHSALCNESYSM